MCRNFCHFRHDSGKLPRIRYKMMSYHLTFPEVGVIIANVDDLDSIEQMCVKAKLLINCVGPVNFFMVFKSK